jgi:hypothetical protein
MMPLCQSTGRPMEMLSADQKELLLANSVDKRWKGINHFIIQMLVSFRISIVGLFLYFWKIIPFLYINNKYHVDNFLINIFFCPIHEI